MLIYIAIACIGANDIMIVEDEYYELKLGKVNVDKEKGAKYTLFAIGVFCSFFVCFVLRHCRSPPLFDLKLKNKLNGGKKDGRTPKKKKV